MPEPTPTLDLPAVLGQYRTETGQTLLALSDASPILLIFLRHFGCSFCRQTLDQVSRIRTHLQERGVRPVFVHLGSPERAKPYFDHYALSDAERVSDPEASLYGQPVFALPRRHVLLNLLEWKVWKVWLQGVVFKHGIGLLREDSNQMPGIFYLRDRTVVRAFRYRTIADEPDYLKLIG